LREWRARWQADDSLVVLYAGLMGWAQDLETVLRVARSVDGRRSWRFVLIGEGPKAAHWKQSAAGLANTIFLPPVSSQEYPQAVEAADICLVPLVSTFRAPAVPGKVSSILAAGRPIAASVPDGNDTAVVLRDSRAGTAVPAGDAAALESAIEVLAGDAALRATMGRNGQAWIEKHATRAAAVSQCELALREVIAGARRLAPKDSTWSPCSS
jgi:glycosyltransferase involved in cell wall biosynthesis